MLQSEEMLDIVNEQDQVVDTLPRSVVYKENRLHQIRCVWLMIQRPDKKFLIMRRAYTKKLAPGWLDGSVVGHVSAGESYKQALHREASEELGLDLTEWNYTLVGKLTPKEYQSRAFFGAFHLDVGQDFQPEYTPDEFVEHYWLSAQEIIDLDQQGERMKDGLPLVLHSFYQDLLA